MWAMPQFSKQHNSIVMNRFSWSFFAAVLLLNLQSCIQSEVLPIEPAITAITLNKDTIVSGTEAFVVTIHFTDGNGDLGVTETHPESNAFVIDNRTNFVDSLTIPFISPNGTIKSIEGEIDFTFNSECCIPLSGIPCTPDADYPPFDQVRFDVIIRDRAGNFSNQMQSPPMYIMCPN